MKMALQLDEHMDSVYYHCRYCGMMFPTQNKLEDHIYRIHILAYEDRDEDFYVDELKVDSFMRENTKGYILEPSEKADKQSFHGSGINIFYGATLCLNKEIIVGINTRVNLIILTPLLFRSTTAKFVIPIKFEVQP